MLLKKPYRANFVTNPRFFLLNEVKSLFNFAEQLRQVSILSLLVNSRLSVV